MHVPRSHVDCEYSPEQIAVILHELGTAHCWEVLELLCTRSSTVSSIARALELEVSDISKSLRRLTVAGFVEFHRHKKQRVYTLSRIICCTIDDTRIIVRIERDDDSCVSIEVPKSSVR